MSRRDWLLALALGAITFLVYQPAWNGGLLWDDGNHITAPALRSIHGLVRIWTDPASAPQYYPLLHTVFWIEYKLWGSWPLPYHLINILLHVTSALLLVKVLQNLEIPGAWFAAAIFALHPVQVESVAWIAELKNTLSAVFCLGAALSYLRFVRDGKLRLYLLAFVLFLLGLMVKTVIATLPMAILVTLWWKQGNLEWKRDVKPLVPFFVSGIGSGLVTAWVERKICGAEGQVFDFSLIDRFLIAGRAFWFYLAKLFWPANLVTIYPRWQVNHLTWWQYLFPIGVLFLLGVLWGLRRRSRGPIAAALIFGVMLFPMLSFLNIAYFMFSFVADHFQYLASIGIFTFFGAGAVRWLDRMQGWRRLAAGGMGLALLVTLAGLSWAQSHVYQDAETCFRTVIAKNPNSPGAHNNLGTALMDRDAVDEAIVQFRKAVDLQPDYQLASYNLGAALMKRGDAAEAVPTLKAVLRANPSNAKANYSLGTALSAIGDREQAIVAYERALKLEPDFPDAHCNLANLLLEKNETDGALAHYREAVRLQPENPGAHYNLAVGLVRKGEADPAINELQIALRLNPSYPDAKPLLDELLAQRPQH
ncbi:MAG TPA: tetratricopeptide repeat protein [Chthoniobacterales bacterium]|nr:tetratricopeptide repeat protein [Chthoniobacterales bacterium]